MDEGGSEGSVWIEEISQAAEAVMNEETRASFDDEMVGG